MSTIIINSSPFHSKATLSESDAAACLRVFQFAARSGRAWKTDWLSAQRDFTFKAGMSPSNVRHYAGELRAVGEFINRVGWRVGLSWNDAAANARGGHNIKRDIGPADRMIHAQAVEVARARGIKATGNTWSAQTMFLRDTDEGKAALADALAILEASNEPAPVTDQEPVVDEPAPVTDQEPVVDEPAPVTAPKHKKRGRRG